MIRTLAAVLITTIAAFAAPVPTRDDFKLKGWGDPVDPLDDCKFVVKDGRLEFTVPGKGRDLSCQWGKMNAPRVLRDKEGDFTITVKVDGTWPLGAKLDLMDRVPFFGAGLFLAADDKNYIRFEKAQYERNGMATCYVSLELWQNGEWIKSGTPEDGELKNDKPLHLKLVRKGDTVTGSFSLDGKEWTELKPLDAKLANKVKVGVGAVHTTLSEFAPVFSDLVVE